MTGGKLIIDYKLYFEAEDIAQTRILSSAAYVINSLKKHKNPYLAQAVCENESDLDEFILRVFVDTHIEEEHGNVDSAESFLDEMAELLAEIARMQSYLEMDGSFSISFEGEQIAYRFASEAGDSTCEFVEQ